MAMYPCLSLPSLSFPTLTGSIVTFNAQYALPLKSHTVALTATQSGSGTPSPDNIRSINGYSELVISNVNTNYFNVDNVYSTFIDGYNVTTAGTSTNTDFYTSNTGASTPVPLATLPKLPFLLAGTYTISCTTTANTELTVFAVDSTGAVTSVGQTSYTGTSKVLTFTLTENTRITIRGRGGITYSNIMLNSGSSALPYTNVGVQVVHTITIGSTVYGGEYDARTGLLTVTHKYFTFDYTSSWNYEYSGGGKNFYVACPSDVKTGQYGANTKMICSASPVSTSSGAMVNTCFISNARNFNFTWGDTLDLYNVQQFKDYLQNNNLTIEVCALLTIPTTIQLPPCPIDTLANSVNNIWADTGDTTLQYPKFG